MKVYVTAGMRGCDAVFGVAAMYEVGIPRRARDAMFGERPPGRTRGRENVVSAQPA